MEKNQLQSLLFRKRNLSTNNILQPLKQSTQNYLKNVNQNHTQYLKRRNSKFKLLKSPTFKIKSSKNHIKETIDNFNKINFNKQFKKNLKHLKDNLDEEDIKIDLRNIENWVYEHFCLMVKDQKLKIKQDVIQNNRRKGKFLIANNYIIKEDTENFDSLNPNRNANQNEENQKRLTITRENLYREINFNIIKDNVVGKLRKSGFDIKNKKLVMRYAKIFYNDIIRCFSVLKNFKSITLRFTEMVNKELLINTLNELENIYSSQNILQKNHNEFEKEVIQEIKLVMKELQNENQEESKIYNKIKAKQNQIKKEKQSFKNFKDKVKQKQNQANQNNRQIKFYMELNKAKLDLQRYELQHNQIISEREKEESFLEEQLLQVRKKTDALKVKKFWLSCKLKDCYLELLEDENKLFNFGKTIIEILTKIYELGETVDKDNFSSFYNSEDIEFIFKFSKKLYLIKKNFNLQKQLHKNQGLENALRYLTNLNEQNKILELKQQMKTFKERQSSFRLNKNLKSREKFQNESQLADINNELFLMKKIYITKVLSRFTNNFKKKVMNKEEIKQFEKICKLIFKYQNISKLIKDIVKHNSIVMISVQLVQFKKFYKMKEYFLIQQQVNLFI